MEINEQPGLVTTCTFKGKQYLVKMNLIRSNSLELSVVDKYSAEEWRCSYDSTFIENLTHKTGNYKQFDIFVTMLKSGLLRTSECVTLDLLTFEDLEHLRSRRSVRSGSRPISPRSAQGINSAVAPTNRRYLILTYTVEFDRIHYPLPMEYVGPPNPQVLQATIRRLEAEVQKLQSKLNREGENNDIGLWRERVRELEAENWILEEEVAHLRQLLTRQTGVGDCLALNGQATIPVALQSLEEQVKRERASFKATLKGLQEQNHRLRREVEDLCGMELSNQKPDSMKVLWQGQGRSPSPRRSHNMSPRKSGTYCPESPKILSMKSQQRGKKWKETLRNDNSNGMTSKVLSDQECTRIYTGNFKRCSHSSSGSSHHGRDKSPTVFKSRAQRSSVILDNTSQKSCPAGYNQRKTSSSGGSSRRKMRARERCSGIRSRSCSQTSSGSATSSSGRSSISGSRVSLKSRSQENSNAFCRNALTIQNKGFCKAGNYQPQKPKSKQGRPRKLPNKDVRAGMSDLETRIEALQKLLREGLSIP